MDIQPIALKSLKSAFSLFTKDLNALPAEAYCQSFGPACRTVADIVYEVNLVNEDLLKTLRGLPQMEWPEGWVTAPEDLRSKEAVLSSFEKLSKEILEVVEGYTETEMIEPIKSDSSETNRFERCRFMTLHLMYHSGQLNFIQTLLGDDVFHWAA